MHRSRSPDTIVVVLPCFSGPKRLAFVGRLRSSDLSPPLENVRPTLCSIRIQFIRMIGRRRVVGRRSSRSLSACVCVQPVTTEFQRGTRQQQRQQQRQQPPFAQPKQKAKPAKRINILRLARYLAQGDHRQLSLSVTLTSARAKFHQD